MDGEARTRRVVAVSEEQPVSSKSIQIRRLNLRSGATEIRLPHVIRKDDDDVGTFLVRIQS